MPLVHDWLSWRGLRACTLPQLLRSCHEGSYSDQEEPTSRGINHAEVRSEDGDLIPFDTARSDGGDACVLLLLAPMDASKAVLMLLLTTRLTRSKRGDRTRVMMLLSQRLSLIEEASV
jgi:hypothetical protein